MSFVTHENGIDILMHPSSEDLEGLERNIEHLRGVTNQSPHHTFQYAAALLSHTNEAHVKEGLQLMETLAMHHMRQTKERASDQQHTRLEPDMGPVFYYYMAVGQCKLKDFSKARICVENMIHAEPENQQGQALLRYINRHEDGNVDMSQIATVAVVVAAGLALFTFWRRR